MLKERWKLIRWLAKFIDENTDKWRLEGLENDDDKICIEKWNRMENKEEYEEL